MVYSGNIAAFLRGCCENGVWENLWRMLKTICTLQKATGSCILLARIFAPYTGAEFVKKV